MSKKTATTKRIAPGTGLDPAKAVARGNLLWYDLSGLEVAGQGWKATAHRYDRLPAKAKSVVRKPVWELSHHSAGLYLRFIADADAISFRWKLRSKTIAMNHMPATGCSGLDLYARDGNRWRWVGLARPSAQENTDRLIVGVPPGFHEYLLYLPLYNGLDSLSLGVNPGAMVTKAPTSPQQLPIVFYGTSITQGGCASRPGMAYPAILGRRLDRPTINLGFSGNAMMDMPLADLLAELDATAFLIDCVPNMTKPMINERAQAFVKRLRQARPKTPIVLVERHDQINSWFLPAARANVQTCNAALRSAWQQLKAKGIKNLYYIRSARIMDPKTEACVDGVHASDYGFAHYADALEPTLRRLVK